MIALILEPKWLIWLSKSIWQVRRRFENTARGFSITADCLIGQRIRVALSVAVVVVKQSQTCIRKGAHEPVAFLWESRGALSISGISNTSFDLNSNKQRILQSVLFEKGFHFFTDSRDYTGITATSLCEFEEKLKIVSARSVECHFRRQDFQKWLNNVIGDVEIATQIARLDTQLSSENLRKELLKIVNKRIREVEKLHDNAV